MTHAAPEGDDITTEAPAPIEPPPTATSASAAEPRQASSGGGGFVGDLARSATGSPSDAAGLARLASTGFMKAMSGFAKGSLEQAATAARQISEGAPVTQVIDQQIESARHSAASFMGIEDAAGRKIIKGTSRKELRARGTALINQSWNAAVQPKDQHPAFSRILDEITHDEARVIRFLAACGSQPVVDVRTKTPFGVGSERVAGGISMICEMAGCLYPERDHVYFANLNRLGLLRFSEEPVADFRRYSLIECQPRCMEAMAKTNKATTVYRSIYLSLFGYQFADICFEMEGYDAGGWKDNDRGDRIIGKGIPELKAKHH
ncbi:MAG: DUF4393 domain-containing protein [Nocardiaceae bacterium]|nr:DUF4393 domain-containing protein [Nocardiaceae bacterium]